MSVVSTPLTAWRREGWRLLLALGFLTRVPVPLHPAYDTAEFTASARYYPWVGLVVGALAALVWAVSDWLFHTPWLAALLSTAATLYLTGAFHEDGLADSADGLGGGLTAERRLAIMKDSRIGSYGSVTLVMALATKITALALLGTLAALPVACVLVVAHAISRLGAVLVMRRLAYVRDTDGKAKPVAGGLDAASALIAVMVLMPVWVWLPVSLSLWLMLACFPVWWWWCHRLRHLIGGYTGDTLGAMQQLLELTAYLVCIAWSIHHA